MSREHGPGPDPRVEAASAELRRLIQEHYPEAAFELVQGDDPEGSYLIVTVEVDDPDLVVDCYVERLLELQVDEELPLYVVPVRPLERVLETAQAPAARPAASRAS